jgi:hypothetical protein
MPAEEVLGDCRLCTERRPLRESHIQSKFLWRKSGVTGAGKTFAVRSRTHEGLNEPHRQDGLKERLLCEQCECRLQRWEDYASRKLFGKNSPVVHRRDGHFLWEGLDYHKLKLFQMSLLWRMGVSTNPYYGFVELGKHQEILRRMLLREDPGEPWRYGCTCVLLKMTDKPLLAIFSQPHRVPFRGHQGYHWWIAVTSHRPPPLLCASFLTREGTWALLQEHFMKFAYLRGEVAFLREEAAKKEALLAGTAK